MALIAAGCGSSGSSSSSTTAVTTDTVTSTSGAEVHVAMKVLEFTPAAVVAKVGQRVVWTNADSSPHNVTYVSGPSFKTSGTLTPGATFSIRLRHAGTIHYVCTLHPWMKATITVSP